METFRLPGKDSRLLMHNDVVYKIRLVYGDKEAGSSSSLPCDVKTMQHEIEEAISLVLSGTLTPLKTDHFIIHTEVKKWNLSSQLIFTHHNQRLKVHTSMITLYIQARPDVGLRPAERRSQSPQTKPLRQEEQASRQARKHTRRYEVKETIASSPHRPKKARSSNERSGIQVPDFGQPGSRHRRYSLRRRDIQHSTNQRRQDTSRGYPLRSQGLETGSQAKERQASPDQKQRGHSASRKDRDIQEAKQKTKQECVRSISLPDKREPELGATAGAQSPPAYAEGGVVQHDVPVRQLGRHEGEQYQLEEQMRLQRLASNLQPPAAAMAQYWLRPRGSFQQMVNAVLTPVKDLFT